MRSPKTGHSRGSAAVVAAVVAAVPMRLLKWPSRTRVVVAAGAAVRLRTANANSSATFICRQTREGSPDVFGLGLRRILKQL